MISDNKPYQIIFRCLLFCCAALSSGVSAQEQTPYDLVSEFGESPDTVVRFRDGPVTVTDTTGYPYLDFVFNLWNTELRGAVTLTLAKNTEKSLIEIKKGETGGACGLTTTYLNNAGTEIIHADIVIPFDFERRCWGEYQGANFMVHEFGHALGFAKHTHHNGVGFMDAAILNQTRRLQFSKEVTQMMRTLYSLPFGTAIPGHMSVARATQPQKTTVSTRASEYLPRLGLDTPLFQPGAPFLVE